MTTTLPIPATADDLTAEWLTAALRDAGVLGDGRVTTVARETVGQGIGVLCQLFRLRPTYDGAPPTAPASVIAKLPSASEQTRQMATAFKFYEREVRFYDEFAHEVALPTARAYVARFDPATGNFVLLLEDLATHRLGDQLAGATLAESRLLVESLAQHHAQWWNHPRLPELDWIPKGDSEINKAGLSLYPMALPSYMERFGDALPAGIAPLAERLTRETSALLDRMSAGPATICHGDWRLDNLFFGAAPGAPPFTAVDWQIAVQTVGTYDLGYFTSQSMDVDLRRAHERELMDLYYDTLRAGGVEDYSHDQFIEDYRATLAFCLVYPVMGGGLGDLSNERGVALARAMTDRCAAAIQDWDAAAVL